MLKPKVGWNIEAKANRLDPGAFAKDWPGAVNFTLSTSGNVEKDGPVAKLKLDGLSGTLRQRALGGNGDLSFAPPLNVDGKLNLSSGQSTVAIVGKGGAGKDAPTDLKIDLGIASLGDWVPKAGGSIRGTIAVNGPYPKLNASGKVELSEAENLTRTGRAPALSDERLPATGDAGQVRQSRRTAQARRRDQR